MRAAAAPAAALALLAGACGDDGDDVGPSGAYDVVLVIGAAIADEAADPAGFPGEGSTFQERWSVDCDGDGCRLGRPDGGVLLGDLDELRLAPVEGVDGTWRGVAEGVQPEPVLGEAVDEEHAEDAACADSPARTWTVTIELSEQDEVLVGSVFRVPEALVDGDCFGLDLTLGLSATPAG